MCKVGVYVLLDGVLNYDSAWTFASYPVNPS